jgi:hypothetical protein
MTNKEEIVKELRRRMKIAKDTKAIGRERYLATIIQGVKNEFKPAYDDEGVKYSNCFDNMEQSGNQTMQLEWYNDFADFVSEDRPTCYEYACEYADKLEQEKIS